MRGPPPTLCVVLGCHHPGRCRDPSHLYCAPGRCWDSEPHILCSGRALVSPTPAVCGDHPYPQSPGRPSG